MNFVFLGPPGAGKGTHAKLLAEHYDWAHVSTGDLLRDKIREGSQIGLKAKAFIDQGQLVPDQVVVEMVRERISEPDAKKGFILDGFPRNTAQAEELDVVLSKDNKKLDYVVDFPTTTDLIVWRLTGRRICKNCGATYHMVNFKPKQEGACDKCGGVLVQREDDKEETIRERLKVYENQTEPLIQYYRKRKILFEVDGDEDVEPLQVILKDLVDGKK